MVRKKGFNLLKTQIEPQTMWTKVYKWTTTTARGIMVIVELIIVLAFGVRVVVDLQFKNLNKDIVAKEEIMMVLQDSEYRLRNIQDKVGVYENLYLETNYYSNIYAELQRITPSNIRDMSVLINQNEVIIKGFADTETIAQTESAFKDSSLFTKTELLNIETQGQQLDSFTLKTKINNLPRKGEVLF